ncbi:MAG: hypothetical protein IKL02_01795 [Kiritimatiellae bacterium]|nr:hypothetical protein [Kiritimatiellia bacterium]
MPLAFRVYHAVAVAAGVLDRTHVETRRIEELPGIDIPERRSVNAARTDLGGEITGIQIIDLLRDVRRRKHCNCKY